MTHHTLVVHTGGIGDLICTLPALQRLQARSILELAGIPERIELAKGAGIVAATHNLERVGFHSVFTTPNDRLRDFARDFDRALVFMQDNDGRIARSLGEAGIGEVHCVPGIPPTDVLEHASQWYARAVGVSITLPIQFDFGPATSPLDVVIQPGSGGAKKNWPLARFQRVAKELTRLGYNVRWCLGPAEDALETLRPRLPAFSLCELARQLAHTRLFIGNDSGISHLAAVSGCPTIALFGPTAPQVWRPMGPRVHVLQDRSWPSWEEVLRNSLDLLEGQTISH